MYIDFSCTGLCIYARPNLGHRSAYICQSTSWCQIICGHNTDRRSCWHVFAVPLHMIIPLPFGVPEYSIKVSHEFSRNIAALQWFISDVWRIHSGVINLFICWNVQAESVLELLMEVVKRSYSRCWAAICWRLGAFHPTNNNDDSENGEENNRN